MYLVGAGGHGKVVAEIFELLKREFPVLDSQAEPGDELLGIQVESERVVFGRLEASVEFFVSIGDARDRRLATKRWQARGHRAVQAAHPSAIVSPHARVDEGVCIMAGAIVQAGSVLERGAIINTGAIVDHDCVVGEFAHVGPGARLAGNVEIGPMSWIGMGSSVCEGQRIGEASIVGAGAVVVSDVPEGVVAYGVPCRVINDLIPDEARTLDSQ
jgi:sugar O-acyltransferase (sialic acid O-acetyltransferase NeuD family)